MNQASYDAIAPKWNIARTRLSTAERGVFELICQSARPGDRVLDLGCGTGRPVAEYLAARGFRITGVDQSPQMLLLARQLLPGEQWLHQNIEMYSPSRSFAAVIAWDSLFHIRREAHEAIFQSVRAALPAGGRFALTLGGSAQPAFTDTMFGHEFFYDSHPPDTAFALLERSGFRIIHHEFLNPPTTGRDKGRIAIVASAT